MSTTPVSAGLAPSSRLGPYEVTARLGAGGMGEVYRARDTRLARDVALKLLPPQLAADPQFRARFEREAKSISALNHPHICTLHDVGSETIRGEELHYLVLELIEGESLAQRLTKGPLPIEDVLRFGVQIASALHARTPAGDRPPRPQAGERDADAVRGETARLRPGPPRRSEDHVGKRFPLYRPKTSPSRSRVRSWARGRTGALLSRGEREPDGGADRERRGLHPGNAPASFPGALRAGDRARPLPPDSRRPALSDSRAPGAGRDAAGHGGAELDVGPPVSPLPVRL